MGIISAVPGFLDRAAPHFHRGFLVEFDSLPLRRYNGEKPSLKGYQLSTLLPKCFQCRRLIRHLHTRTACTRYPKGVPHEIIMGRECPFFEPEEDLNGRRGKTPGRRSSR